MIRVCFVCLGNICRSPTAEAVMRHLVKEAGLDGEIVIESAGTGDWHVGGPRDDRSAAVGQKRGIPLGGKAQQFGRKDFARFDHVIAMDRSNVKNLIRMAPDDGAKAKVRLLRSFEAEADDPDVPDPYYGGPEGFDRVFDICERGCRGLLAHLRHEHGLRPK
jgi:protein-tyrosine phosphatase